MGQGGQIRWGLRVPGRLCWVLVLWVQCGQLGKGTSRSRSHPGFPRAEAEPRLACPPSPRRLGHF